MNEDIKKFIQTIRKNILESTDYTQLPDAPLTEEKKQEWSIYRQQIRDMTELPENQNVNDVSEVIWPVRPE